MAVQVKICGITSSDDACAAAQAGADFIGVIVEITESQRSVNAARARRIISAVSTPVVVVTEKNPLELLRLANDLKPFALQIIGVIGLADIQGLKTRIACQLWKTVQIPASGFSNDAAARVGEQIVAYRDSGIDVIVLDTLVQRNGVVQKGGTGQTCDWLMAEQLVARAPLPVLLAGGINPANVRAAIDAVHPWGVDVSSGVELRPGKKDPAKMVQLIKTVHAV